MFFKQKLGKFGEELACKYLKGKGYKIIDQNYYARSGEIDIIAKYNDVLVFVEVKTRTNQNFGLPEEAIDYYKQQKLKKTVEYYLLKHNFSDQNFRVDSVAIEIDRQTEKAKIRHEENII
jgi:putative endonuclease